VDGRPNRRNKAAFSNFSKVMWTGLSERHREVLQTSFLEKNGGLSCLQTLFPL